MPAKNVVKVFTENGHYHVYNRGVEKRKIFQDEHDYAVFLYYLKIYLSPVEELKQLITSSKMNMRVQRFFPLNLSQELDLLTFVLMPNHVHLLIKQYKVNSITKLMHRLSTSYTMYFNKKYKRVGSLFQGVYKACLVETDEYLLHLSRYIHLNPGYHLSSLRNMNFSSYPYYLGNMQASWVKPETILHFFR
ncbi:MAG: transposase, partial [Candidatus Levybacteria bacterium]|nr:transposase [Candidatus Levybacteria bacterium]